MIENLKIMDWDFAEVRSPKSLHNIHPYPAKFIPELPEQLIKELGHVEGTAVLDPFCGSGTTMSVCQKLGIPSVGIDLNPIACLISQVKTSSVPSDLLVVAQSICKKSQNGKILDCDDLKIPNVDHWFKKDIQKAILAIKAQISQLNREDLIVPLNLCLSRGRSQSFEPNDCGGEL